MARAALHPQFYPSKNELTSQDPPGAITAARGRDHGHDEESRPCRARDRPTPPDGVQKDSRCSGDAASDVFVAQGRRRVWLMAGVDEVAAMASSLRHSSRRSADS